MVTAGVSTGCALFLAGLALVVVTSQRDGRAAGESQTATPPLPDHEGFVR
jgi:hypothetical protein